MYKKVLLVFILCFSFILDGCSSNKVTGDITKVTGNNTSVSLNVVCTTFPIYDWVKNIVKDDENVEASFLLNAGQSLHGYEPSAEDIVKIKESDVLIYIGGESDLWMDSIIKENNLSTTKVIKLLDILGADAYEKTGLNNNIDSPNIDSKDEEPEYDEHVWLSVRNAELFCTALCDELSKLNESKKDVYTLNKDNYIEQLESINKDFEEFLDGSNKSMLVFGSKFPFSYFVKDYDIKYYAAFNGCSAEAEASFDLIKSLSSIVEENEIRYIIDLEGVNDGIPETIINSTKNKDQEVLTVNSMGSVTIKMVEDGLSYIDIMQKNFNTFKEALK